MTGPSSNPGAGAPPAHDLQAVEILAAAYKKLVSEIRKVIVGQDQVVEQMLMAMFSRGHCLLVGVPGLAKTLLVSTISRILDLSFRRIQFTPDLMPSDITGTDILQEEADSGRRVSQFVEGPLFANIILADEINRTPPKTQAALLEAMQEHHVTSGQTTYPLPEPFFVLATQNPIEQEGTYPLPEAQLDRFMFEITIDYPDPDEELAIMKQTTSSFQPELTAVLSGHQILQLQALVRKVPAADHVFVYARDLTRATRPKDESAPEFVRRYVAWGAGPRASQCLIMGAKARAILHGRLHVTTDDIRAVAHPVLRHRIVTTFSAEAEGVEADDLVERLLDTIRAPQEAAADRIAPAPAAKAVGDA